MKWVTLDINGSDVSIAFDDNSIHVYNAYPIKDDLKIRGYRWNPSDKSWFIRPGSVNSEMTLLKNNLQETGVETVSPSLVPTAPTAPAGPEQPGAASGKELSPFPSSYSVADLRNRIDRLIREGIRGKIWVRGVIASDVKHYKWASYLDLKDEDEKRDMFFRVEVRKQQLEVIRRKLRASGVAQDLERDLPVFCSVEVHLPLRYAVDVRLTLLDILPEYTQSKIRNQRDITLDKLHKEGILDKQKQLVMPMLISRIGLITSEQGTSVRDIKAGLHPYGDKFRFFFVDSRMEGGQAVDGVIRALDYLENSSGAGLDAVIIARGGGSEQSLAVFNDYRLCRGVCLAGIPVITAIGHEKDVSAVESCSWLTPTPSTPSGVGKYLHDRYAGLRDRLAGTVTSLIHRFSTVHHRESQKIESILRNLPPRAAGYIKMKEERFADRVRGLERAVSFSVRDQERRLDALSRQLVTRGREIRKRGRQAVTTAAARVLERSVYFNRGEYGQVEKTIRRLDFKKRHGDNRLRRQNLERACRFITGRGAVVFQRAQKDLEARRQLVNAFDPRQILKKGFTLTLGPDGKVITSVSRFPRTGRALLEFHDGKVAVKKSEEDA